MNSDGRSAGPHSESTAPACPPNSDCKQLPRDGIKPQEFEDSALHAQLYKAGVVESHNWRDQSLDGKHRAVDHECSGPLFYFRLENDSFIFLFSTPNFPDVCLNPDRKCKKKNKNKTKCLLLMYISVHTHPPPSFSVFKRQSNVFYAAELLHFYVAFLRPNMVLFFSLSSPPQKKTTEPEDLLCFVLICEFP